jgi:hypothetical protein
METSLPFYPNVSTARIICTDSLSFPIGTRGEMSENELADTSTEMRAQRFYKKIRLVS